MELTLWGRTVEVDESRPDASPAEVRRQAAGYERGERCTLDLSVSFPSAFTGRVMEAMAAIPYGETRTYGELARDLDSGPRALGSACGRSPVPLVVPCHRVVAADGLGGFSPEGGTALKRALIDHERAHAGGRLQNTLGEGNR
jgi:methylated-DNA-[protein]-cysteine S-methyltransferase